MPRITVTTQTNPLFRLPVGRWLNYAGPQSSFQPIEGRIYAMPYEITQPRALDQLSAEIVTTAGSVGSVIRLGAYADDGNGMPGALLVDAGTVDGTVIASPTLSVSIASYVGRIFLCGVSQGAAVTIATMRSSNTNNPAAMPSAAPAGISAGYQSTPVNFTGALPATFPASMAAAATVIRVSARIA